MCLQLQTKTVREVVYDKLVCRYNSLSARGCLKHPIILIFVKLCIKLCEILRSRATTTFTRPKGLTHNGFLLVQRALHAAQQLIPYGNWRWI